jgi:hypothetical protein
MWSGRRHLVDNLNQILSDATALVGTEYFRLPVHGADPVYRERVYCYELYHQMRCGWPAPDMSPYRLNAEVDKTAHAALHRLGVRGQKPDLLIHRPGNMEGNHTIIEVKPAPSAARDIRKDLRTLALFRDVGYDRTIFLIFGHRADDRMVRRVRTLAETVGDCAGIEIWLHNEAGAAARQVATLD